MQFMQFVSFVLFVPLDYVRLGSVCRRAWQAGLVGVDDLSGNATAGV
ncbi:hypothetical protein [Streptomyces sp. UG1]